MSGVTVATMIASRSEAAEAALGQRLSARFGSQVAGGYTLVYDVALANAGALDNPVIGCFHHLFQILVGQQTRWNIGSQGSDLDPHKLAQSMRSPGLRVNPLF